MMQMRRKEIREVENILETWSNRERSRNGSYAWRHQNEQTHIAWGPLPLFLGLHPGPWTPICYRGPRWTLEPSLEDFDPAAVESDSASEL